MGSGEYYVARVHGFSSAKPSSGVSAGGLTGDGDWEFSSDLRLFPGEKELHVVSSNTKTPLGVSAHVWSVASMWDE